MALETSGLFAPAKLTELIDVVDLFLMDIKVIDDKLHKKLTGVSNKQILSNFAAIIKQGGHEKILPRIPLIPSVNTQPESVKQIIAFLKSCGHPGPVHLMPYNPLAKNKWEKIGRGNEYRVFGRMDEEILNLVTRQFEDASFEVVINK